MRFIRTYGSIKTPYIPPLILRRPARYACMAPFLAVLLFEVGKNKITLIFSGRLMGYINTTSGEIVL